VDGMSQRARVAVLISGNGSNLQALIDACAAPDFPAEIVHVISNHAEAYGLMRAERAGIATLVINHKTFPDREAFDAALHEALVECNAELVCLAGFMRLLTPGFVTKWQGRMINIHPSLLPAFKGLHTHRLAIETGVKFAGCSVHFVVPEMDAGPLIIQSAVPVLPNDTEKSLAERVLAQEHQIYPQALKWLAEGRLSVVDEKVNVNGARLSDMALVNPGLDS
jgi:phosphoribosylglycinamide formyltransferase 1